MTCHSPCYHTPPPLKLSVNLSNITILLSLQFKVIKSDMQSCGVCYFTFVVLHLHTACPSSLQELEQCPVSIYHLHDMAYIQRAGGGYRHYHSFTPTSLHQMLLVKSLAIIFDLVLTIGVILTRRTIRWVISNYIFYVKPEHTKNYKKLSRPKIMSLLV